MKTKFRYLFTSAGLVALLSIALLGSSTAAFAEWFTSRTRGVVVLYGDHPGLRFVSGSRNLFGRRRLLGSRSVVVQPRRGRERRTWRVEKHGAWKFSSDLCQSHFRQIQHGSADWNFESPPNRDDRQDRKFVQRLWRLQLLRYRR